MIHHLAINTTWCLNVFPSKGGVSGNHIPPMILSQSHCYYNKHFQVEFIAYVQASQFNDKKKKNRPRTLDGIYLLPAPSLQGGNQIMDIRLGQYITRTKLFDIPITYFVINFVEIVAEEKGCKSLKLKIEKERNYFSLC